MRITKTKALELIRKSKGKYFGVSFYKKNGELRAMSARLGVKKGVNGKGQKYNPADFGLLTAYSKDGFRMINLNTLVSLKVEGEEYRIV